MKNCKYCAEEIQEEAKKCKHCGEWLDDNSKPSMFSTAKGLFGKSSSFLKEQIEKHNERKTSHIFIPTDENPLELKEVTFYSNHFVHGLSKHNYHEIKAIKFHSQIKNVNGINADIEIDFKIRLESKVVDLSGSNFFGIGSGRKTREQMDFMNLFLKKKTFDIRLLRFINELKTQGYFAYGSNYKFFNNGDVEAFGEVADNIYKANIEERLDYHGTKFSSLLGRSSEHNPYCMNIWKSKDAIRFALFSSRTDIYLYYDKDVVDVLVQNLLRSGSFLG